MTSELFNHVSASSDFLLAKTDASCLMGDAHRNVHPATDTPPKALADAFPELLAGRAFLDRAMELLASVDVFCVCAVRISSVGAATETGVPAGADLAVAGALHAACRKEGGLWGMIDEDLFGCFFPKKDSAFAESAVTLIREGLPELNRPSVIIGTAGYPEFSFEKPQILENACKAVDHACFFGPDGTAAFDDVSLNISGDKLFQAGDIHTAVSEYQAALRMNPENINVRNSLGVCYGLLDRLDLAKEEFVAAVSADEGEYMALYNLGLVHMLTGEQEAALGFFKKAETLSDDVFEVTFQIGRLLVDMGDVEDGISYLTRAIGLDSTSAQAFRALGDGFAARDMLPDAVGAYKKAIKLNPSDAASLSALGEIYDLRDENTEIATLYCEKSIQLVPAEGLFHLRLGRLYLKQDRVEEARRAFGAAAELGHSVPDLTESDTGSRKVG